MLEEKAKIHKFVQEHLSQGTIHISKSPYAANFFFVKKKMENFDLYKIIDPSTNGQRET